MENIQFRYNDIFFIKNNIIIINNFDTIPEKSSVLFVNAKLLINNINNIQIYLNKIKETPHTYIIILDKTDKMLDKDIIIPNNIKYIYSNNINYDHNKIKFIPMGRDFRSISNYIIPNLNHERTILCYCNYSLNTHKIRKKIFYLLKDKKFIKFENMGRFLNYSITRDKFFERLINSKFTICPRGNAYDTFRFYDSIYSGSIPIVIREAYHNNKCFDNIPILFLKNVKCYKNLTKDFLNKKYRELSPMISNYYPGLDFNWWINNIKNELLSPSS
jgi:hypothetical protein